MDIGKAGNRIFIDENLVDPLLGGVEHQTGTDALQAKFRKGAGNVIAGILEILGFNNQGPAGESTEIDFLLADKGQGTVDPFGLTGGKVEQLHAAILLP
jgi:hypothetical protein